MLKLAVFGSARPLSLARHTLARMATHCAALCTADRIRLGDQPGSVVVQYQGSTGDIDVVLDGTVATTNPAATIEGAHQLIQWTYRPEPIGSARNWAKERLSITRSVLHERLRTMDASSRTTRLAGAITDVSGELDWHWRTFVGGEIAQHSGAMRDYKDTVTTQSLDLAAHTSQLTSDVLDAMKAAVATILGSFIGAALSTSFNATIFRIGIAAYALYLVFFAGVLGLGASLLQFLAATEAFASRRKRAVELLGETRVSKLEDGLLASSKSWYLRAFAGAAALYVVVLGVAIWAFSAVPDLLADPAPTAVSRTKITLSASNPNKSWAAGGLKVASTLTASLERRGPSNLTLSLTVTGPRTNVCRLDDPQNGDGLLLRHPTDNGRKYLLVVQKASKQTLELQLVEVRGTTGLEANAWTKGCAQLGEAGIDWKRPGWAT